MNPRMRNQLLREASEIAYELYKKVRELRGLTGEIGELVLTVNECVRAVDAVCYCFDPFFEAGICGSPKDS